MCQPISFSFFIYFNIFSLSSPGYDEKINDDKNFTYFPHQFSLFHSILYANKIFLHCSRVKHEIEMVRSCYFPVTLFIFLFLCVFINIYHHNHIINFSRTDTRDVFSIPFFCFFFVTKTFLLYYLD